ncbi:uncharacterized protein [Musca autumnalis]|uniref:uncharacterized protein n=1 Tax=Musca autumnalis TaxID=221902 RepID=UPI003CF9FE3C
MQTKTNTHSQITYHVKTTPLASSATAKELSLLGWQNNYEQKQQQQQQYLAHHQQIKCNMLLKFNTIKTNNNSNNKKMSINDQQDKKDDNININDNEKDNMSNYTDYSCNSSPSGCMSDTSCLKSACSISTVHCHSNHSLMSPSSMSANSSLSSSSSLLSLSNSFVSPSASQFASTKDNSNYMHCADNRRTCNIYTTTSASTMTTKTAKSLANSCNGNNNDYNVANRDCNSSRPTQQQFSHNNYNNNNKTGSSGSNSKIKTFNSFPWTTIFGINNNNSSLNGLIKFAIILIFLAICDTTKAVLHDVNLFIEPPAVRRNQSVTLRCQYSLGGVPLYSVKFYRGQLEFFRYTPGEYPNTKVFHYPGIKVDESVSNATQVVIRNVNFGLSGNFSCEVTADAPLFSTATAYAQMQVVEFPDKRPQLFTEHTRYEPGDVLRANCSTPPSWPRAELRFTINNMPVSSEETLYIRTVDNLIASRLSLKLQLQSVHFTAAAPASASGSNAADSSSNSHMINALGPGGTTYVAGSSTGTTGGGGLLLRCSAQIGDLYLEYKEIELGTPQKDPIPARVTSSVGGFRGFLETYFGPTSAAVATHHSKINSILHCSCFLIICIAAGYRR